VLDGPIIALLINQNDINSNGDALNKFLINTLNAKPRVVRVIRPRDPEQRAE
jgi:hypothetical protein